MNDALLEGMSLRAAIEYASNAGRVAVIDGLMLDNIVFYHLCHFDYVWLLNRIKRVKHYAGLRDVARRIRDERTSLERNDVVAFTAKFTSEFAKAAATLLAVYEKRPDVMAAMRLAASQPVAINSEFHDDSYLCAIISFARPRCISFMTEADCEATQFLRGAADVAASFAMSFETNWFDKHFEEIARRYFEWADFQYLARDDAPRDHLGEDFYRIAIEQEARRAAYLLNPAESLKAIREAQRPAIVTAETQRVIELLRGGAKPGAVAARLGKSVDAVRQIKSRARRRGHLDS
jgi:hypothetical protein